MNLQAAGLSTQSTVEVSRRRRQLRWDGNDGDNTAMKARCLIVMRECGQTCADKRLIDGSVSAVSQAC